MSHYFAIIRSFPRRRSKNTPDNARYNISMMTANIHFDLEDLRNEHTRLKQAVERSIYEKLLRIAYKAKALERYVEESKISTQEEIPFVNCGSYTIYRSCVETLMRVVSFRWDLPMEYSEEIKDIIASNIHRSKIKKHMPTNTPRNLLDDLYTKLSSAPMYFREEVSRSCGWSLNTFFARKGNRVRLQRKRVLDHPLTEAEAEKIISVFKNTIIPALQEACLTWEQRI